MKRSPHFGGLCLWAGMLGVLLEQAALADSAQESQADVPQAADSAGLEDEFAFLEESGEVEISARHKQEIGMSASAVTVLTQDDIEASGATSVLELLRVVPGMGILLTTPGMIVANARLYWTDEPFYFVVLVDGRDLTSETMGGPPVEFHAISIQDIERIEVIRGPGSFLYGADALMGVIQITTKKPTEKTSIRAGVVAGEISSFSTHLRVSTSYNNWSFVGSAAFENQNLFSSLQETGRHVLKLRSLVQYRFSESQRLSMEFSAADGHGRAGAFVGPTDVGIGVNTLRMRYEEPNVLAQVYWMREQINVGITTPFSFGGAELARFVPIEGIAHMINAEAQWTLPSFYDPLLILLGGGGRVNNLSSGQLLSESYADPTSPDYHKPGASFLEIRANAFVHAEWKMAQWLTASTSLRLDYNNDTQFFFSPRLALVFSPSDRHHIRLSATRAFRKPNFLETKLHPLVTFPPQSPVQGTAQEKFQEFMTRVIGNDQVTDEHLVGFEAGYLGAFFDSRFSVALDLFYYRLSQMIDLVSNIALDAFGLPDLKKSSVYQINVPGELEILGSELTLRLNLSSAWSLLASWCVRYEYDTLKKKFLDRTPKNLITAGGRYAGDMGIVGSLYLTSRSDYWDRLVENPAGLLEPLLVVHQGNVFCLTGKLGWRWAMGEYRLESGLKLFLPVSPWEAPHFRFRDKGGFISSQGKNYGGELLGRQMVVYLQGGF